jgi:hypothetical protein
VVPVVVDDGEDVADHEAPDLGADLLLLLAEELVEEVEVCVEPLGDVGDRRLRLGFGLRLGGYDTKGHITTQFK